MRLSTHIATLAGSAALALSVANAAGARELSFAIGHPPGSYLIDGGETLAKIVEQETKGEVTVKVYPMSLLSMAETSAGLREGLADVGTVMSTYFPAEFPHTNLIMESSMMLQQIEGARGVEAIAFSGAMAEFIFTKCPECNEEFAAQNQVYAGGAGTPGYALNCTKPVVTEADLQGARLRIGGANWSRWSEYVGAAPITMSGNEMLEALSQGVLDCIILSVPDVQNFGMGDSVKHITMGAPGGVYVASMANLNKDVWTELTEDQRRAFLRGAAYGAAQTSWAYQKGEQEVLEKIKANGVEVHEAGPKVLEKTAEFVEQDRKTMIEYYAAQHSVERGDEMLADFRALLEKWVELVRAAEGPEAYGDLYWNEIYSKVDVSKHGF